MVEATKNQTAVLAGSELVPNGQRVDWSRAESLPEKSRPSRVRALAKASYSCEIRVTRGEDLKYLAYVSRLAGVYGQGDTLEEVIRDVCEALESAVQGYMECNKPIPWRDGEPKGAGEQTFQVIVNA